MMRCDIVEQNGKKKDLLLTVILTWSCWLPRWTNLTQVLSWYMVITPRIAFWLPAAKKSLFVVELCICLLHPKCEVASLSVIPF